MKFYMDIPISFPGNVQKQFDLIVPDGDPADIPLLVWIHGGAWCGGEKRVYNEFERFTNRGYALLSIDYRFSQEAPFPAQLIDCKTAIRWARANASRYGYNADRIMVGGSSAGGHLAALLGVTNGMREFDRGPDPEYSSDVQVVVDLFGPMELTADAMPDLKQELQALLHDDPELTVQASPLSHIDGTEPPFLIVHGSADPLVPICQSRKLFDALCEAGANARYVEIEGGVHGFDTPEFYHTLSDYVAEQFPLAPRTL